MLTAATVYEIKWGWTCFYMVFKVLLPPIPISSIPMLVWRCYFKMTETYIRERHTIDTHILRLRHFLQLTLKMPAEARRTDSASLVSLYPSIYTHSRSVFNMMCVWAQSVSQAPPTSESYSPCETHQLCLNGPYAWLVDEDPNQQVSYLMCFTRMTKGGCKISRKK